MTKTTHALAAVSGCAAGFLLMATIYAQCFFRHCENLRDDGSFECSYCRSKTDYKPKVPFRFCPMCGAYVEEKKRHV